MEASRPIHPGASAKTKLTIQDGRLHHKNRPVDTVKITTALKKFIEWLKEQDQPLLIGHNAKAFDCMFLLNALERTNLTTEFRGVICGFSDSFLMFMDHLPQRGTRFYNFKQEVLVEDLLGEEGAYGAHDAAEDVRVLQLLVDKQRVPYSLVKRHRFDVDHILQVLKQRH